MYLLGNFSKEFDFPYNLINMNGQVYKMRKLNRNQEILIYNSFGEIKDDINLFIPSMYAMLVGTKGENVELFKKSFADEINLYKTTESEMLKTIEIIAAKNIFKYVCAEAGLLEGTFSKVLESSLQSALEEVDNGGTRLYFPFLHVLKIMGYNLENLSKMNGAELVKLSFKEVIFSGNANLLVYLADKAYKQNEEIDIPRFFKLFTEFNTSEASDITGEIQKYIAIYKSPINIFGELGEGRSGNEEKGFKKGVVVIDGEEIDLDEREKALKAMGIL